MGKSPNFYFNVIKKEADETLISSLTYNGESSSAMRKMNKKFLFWENLGYEVRFCETRKEADIT